MTEQVAEAGHRSRSCTTCEFIHARIVELLDPNTQEEDQARLHNSWSLLLELAEQCELDEDRIKSKPFAAESILAELKRALKREADIGFSRPTEKNWPPFANLLAALKSDNKNWTEAARLARILGHSMKTGSAGATTKLFKHSCPSTPDQNLHKIDELCEYWATDMRWAGHSSAKLHQHLENVHPTDIVMEMSRFPSEEEEFRVVVRVLGVTDLGSSSLFAPVPEDVREKVKDAFGERRKSNLTMGLVSVTARDSDAAARLGRQVAERFLAVGALVRTNREINVSDPVVVLGGDGEISEHQTALPSGYPHRPRTGGDWWPNVAELVARNNGAGLRALDVALRHHWLSCSAPTIDSRIVNLWTAFEVLFADGSEATSVSVAETVSRMVSGMYVRYYVRRLAIDLARGSKAEQKIAIREALAIFSADTEVDTKVTFPPESLALTLSSPKDSIAINALYAALSENPLLRRKVTRARRILQKPESLGERLEHHKETISWQIGRIYRARNAIVHGRTEMPSTVAEPLLRHAHHYLSLAIHQIMHGVSVIKAPSLEGVIKRCRAMYDFVVRGLATRDSLELPYKALTAPDWWGAPHGEPSLWTSASLACEAAQQSTTQQVPSPVPL